MSPLSRIITVLLCTGLGGHVHAHDLIRECPSSPVADISDENVSPFDLIWDVSDGTTSQGVKQSTELLIFVTPKLTSTTTASEGTMLNCEDNFERARYRVDFVPKVTVEVVVANDKSEPLTETLELDGNRQAAVLSYPYINGGTSRLLQRVKVSARGSSCCDVQARLYTVDAESGETLAEVKLPAVFSKAVPPQQFDDGDGAVEP